jgi:thiol-disulfide isomerase/thioredoxin
MLLSIAVLSLTVASGLMALSTAVVAAEPPQAPEHRVVAIYFHRTERCPTCQRIGTMAEQAVREEFVKQMEEGVVDFRFVDFQDKANADLARSYGIKTPTLVLVNEFDGAAVCATPMPKVWQLVGKPVEFREYVVSGVVRYLKQSREDAEQEHKKSKEVSK